jgi:hypothetical protein
MQNFSMREQYLLMRQVRRISRVAEEGHIIAYHMSKWKCPSLTVFFAVFLH